MITITGKPGAHDTYSSAELVELERPDGTKNRFTNAAGNLTYNGAGGDGLPDVAAEFFTEPFNLKGIYRGGGQIVGSIEFPDIMDTLKALAQLYQMVGWTCRVWRVGVDDDFAITWIRWEAEAIVVEVDQSLRSTRIDFDSSPDIGESERYTIGCPFVLGGERCGVVGDTSAGCDHLFSSGCLGYVNQQRYGGFRRLPVEGEQLPEWGGVTYRYQMR